MPPVETFCRNQKAVLWVSLGHDKNGLVQLDLPIEVDVRMESARARSGDPKSESVARSIDYCVFDRNVPEGSVVWEGRKKSLVAGHPPAGSVLFKVTRTTIVPDLKNLHRKYTATLEHYSGTLPEVVGT